MMVLVQPYVNDVSTSIPLSREREREREHLQPSATDLDGRHAKTAIAENMINSLFGE